MYSEIQLVLQLALGLVFLLSSLPKIRQPMEFAKAVDAYRIIPSRYTLPAALVVICSELFVTFAHISGVQLQAAIAVSTIMLAVFLGVVLWTLRSGASINCACFSSSSEEVISGKTAVRLLMLIAAEVTLWFLAERTLPIRDVKVEHAIVSAITAVLVLTFTAWLFSIPDLVVVVRNCAACMLRKHKLAELTKGNSHHDQVNDADA